MANPSAKQPGKISVACPHCGFAQLESVYAQSTICRKCSTHLDLTRQQQEEQSASRGAFSFLGRFERLLARPTSKTIRCFNCQASQTVSSSAKSSICPHCATYIDLRDFKISGTYNRSIQTQGDLIVTAKGDVTSTKVVCGSATIHGKVRGNVSCSGETNVKLKGRVPGGIESRQLTILKGSDVEFVRPLKVGSAEILGKVSAIIMADGVVTIRKSGSLEGTLYAKSITVEKGGVFHGELYIGQQQLEQPELLGSEEEERQLGLDGGESLVYSGAS